MHCNTHDNRETASNGVASLVDTHVLTTIKRALVRIRHGTPWTPLHFGELSPRELCKRMPPHPYMQFDVFVDDG
jgi:hypothetical protein